jgi:serine/threonine-protein kinase RsbW
MRLSSRFACEMRTTVPATLDAIEEFLGEVRCRVQNALPQADCFAAELLAREALTNAVVHGCHADSRKHVLCAMRLRGRRLTIAVQDEGEGFDWRAAWNRPGNTAACSSRGIQILRTFAIRVRYNEKGNAVTIIKEC